MSLYTYKMMVQYDGGRYSGWQRQGNTGNTIQSKLERVLSDILEEEIEISGSGRTDAGVHALGQIASFQSKSYFDCPKMVAEANKRLPEDIAVRGIGLESPKFHARFSAKEKTYQYVINQSVIPDVFRRKYEYHYPGSLNVGAMRSCALHLLGTHDFKGFSTGRTNKSTVRTMKSIDIRQEGTKLYLTFTGDGFLYNMVRILTGTLIEVGEGKRRGDSVEEVFRTLDRSQAGFTAPAQGLCLMSVTY
ncbi:MAG: tRNA pseudouridine(38-40) synthase TruA [Oscillospiraceae bacterium]|nr:tRNA pseudouridine(38-40) synthase TruA [Oscillospiraceae bacterium]